MTENAATLYQVLDVAQDAMVEAIQDAYYARVREHPPEKDSEGFQRITRAYEVLSQATSRKEYDETLQADHETQRLIEEGRKLLENGDEEALAPLKRALVRHPDSPMIRDLVVQALMVNENWEEASKHAQKVLSQEPSNPAYNLRFGDVLYAREAYVESAKYHKKAMNLDGGAPIYTVRYATALLLAQQPNTAERVLEDAIQRDGQVNFNDFQYFQSLCRVHSFQANWKKLESVHERIRRVLPPDQETRSYVAWFYFADAMGMANATYFEGALRSIDEAARIDDSLPELREIRERMLQSKSAIDEAIALREDETMPMALRFAACTLTLLRIMGEQGELKSTFEQATENLDREVRIVGGETSSKVVILRNKYPNVARAVSDFLETVEKADLSAPKDCKRVGCPECGFSHIVARPSVSMLCEMGFSTIDAIQIAKQPEHEILEHLTLSCSQCGAEFTGTGVSPSQVSASPAGANGGCFVVTAACGREDAFAVRVLRSYRDERLVTNYVGRFVIAMYGKIGPIAARVVLSHESLRRIVFRVVNGLARETNRRHHLGFVEEGRWQIRSANNV